MKITYTGRQVELKPAQLKKLEAQFAKIGKLLDGKRECEAHVILSLQRHLHHAEATINYFGHQLAGLGSDADLFTAIHAASSKLEKQAVKARTKWRDSKRKPHEEREEPAPPVAKANGKAEKKSSAGPPAVRVHHVTNHEREKPMTLDEAILAMDGTRDYLAYRDAATGSLCFLTRRRDGHFDLVEG